MNVMTNVTGIISKTQKSLEDPSVITKILQGAMTTIFRTDRQWVFEPRFFLGSSTHDLPVFRINSDSFRCFKGEKQRLTK